MNETQTHELPPVRRLRDYYLYTEDGRRLLDMSLDSGGAFCGHRPSGFTAGIKRILSRGGTAAVPSREGVHAANWLRRFQELFLPGYADYRAVLLPPAAAPRQLPPLLGLPEARLTDCWDPAAAAGPGQGSGAAADLLVIRPGYTPGDLQQRLHHQLQIFADAGARPAALLPLLPVARSLCPQLVLLRPDRDIPEAAIQPASEIGEYCVSFGLQLYLQPRYPSFSTKRQDILWFPGSLADAGWQNWYAAGPYQYFRGSHDAYRQIFTAALAHGVLLPLDPAEPAIMPAAITARDRRILRELAACTAGDKPAY